MKLKELQWDEKYNTGIDLIDLQHKGIFNQYNNFCKKINTHDYTINDIDNFLKDLNYYTSNHFKTEEKFMLKEKFPGYKEHKKRHCFFKAVYEEIKENKFLREYSEGLFTLHLAETAAEWLESHVATYDKELAAFLKKRGY